MKNLTPVDALLLKINQKILEGEIEMAPAQSTPLHVPNEVDKLCQELNDALLEGEFSIKKSYYHSSYEHSYKLELTKEEALELRDNLAKELGLK